MESQNFHQYSVTRISQLTAVSVSQKGTLKFHPVQQYEEAPYSLDVNGGRLENVDFHLHLVAGGGTPASPTKALSEESCCTRFK